MCLVWGNLFFMVLCTFVAGWLTPDKDSKAVWGANIFSAVVNLAAVILHIQPHA